MNKEILRLAIPNIITNITVPLLGMVDTSIVGHLDSAAYIGAIAIATMIFNFIYWNFAFLRMGTSGFTAQSYGAGNKVESAHILFRSVLIAFSIALLLILFQYPVLQIAFVFVHTNPEVEQYAKEYFYIYIWAAPAVLGMYAMTGWFIGMQDAKTPMIVSIMVNIINIGLSLLFVFVFGMKITGVALGSLLSQWIAFLLIIGIWLRKYSSMRRLFTKSLVTRLDGFIPFFKVNGDIFLRSLALVLVTTFFTSASSGLGDTYLAVNTLLMQLFIFFSYMMDGFAYAAEALTGRFVGSGQQPVLKQLIRRLFIWGIALASLFSLFYALFTDSIIGLLTDKTALIEASRSFQVWTICIPLAGFAAFLWDGIFIGMTASKAMRNSMFIAVALFFLFYMLLVPRMGNTGLWISFLVYLFMRGFAQTCMFPGLFRKLFIR